MAVTILDVDPDPGPGGPRGGLVNLRTQAWSSTAGRLRMVWVRQDAPGTPVEQWAEFTAPPDPINADATFDGSVAATEAPQVSMWLDLGASDGTYALRATAEDDTGVAVAHSNAVSLAATYEILFGPTEVDPPAPGPSAPVTLRATVTRSVAGAMQARWIDGDSGEDLGGLPETAFQADVPQTAETSGLVNDPDRVRRIALVIGHPAGVREPVLASDQIDLPLGGGVAPEGITLLEAVADPPPPVAPGAAVTLRARLVSDSRELWAVWTRLEEGAFLPVGAPLIGPPMPGEQVLETPVTAQETATYRLAAGHSEAEAMSGPPVAEIVLEVAAGSGDPGRLLWRRVTTLGPGPIAGHAVTLDAARRRMVLHGGRRDDGTAHAGTWEWIDGFWVQVSGLAAPGAGDGVMAYDHERRAVVLHGRGDTFEWDGAHWSQVAEDGPEGSALCDGRGSVVLVSRTAPASRTWAWDGVTWTERDEGALPVCSGFGAAFVPQRDVVVVAGGVLEDGALDDITWEWDGSTWTARSSFGPTRVAPLLTAMGDTVVLFGGRSGPESGAEVRGDTWHWNGRLWSQRLDFGPGVRSEAAICTDAATRPLVVGGVAADGRLLDDTWAYAP